MNQITTNSFRKAIITYMSKSHMPVSLIAPKKEWLFLKYDNSLFKAHTTWNNDGVCTFHMNYNNLYQSPVDYMSRIFESQADRTEKTICDTLSKNVSITSDNDMIRLDSRGKIPIRFLLMLKDFHFSNAAQLHFDSSVKLSSVNDYWNDHIMQCSETVAENIIHACDKKMNEPRFIITVHAAPSYDYNLFTKINLTEKEKYEINKKIWYTGDANTMCGGRGLSTPARVCLDNSAKLYSLGNKIDANSCLVNKPTHPMKYEHLFKTEGGINMRYIYYQPWHTLKSMIRQFTYGDEIIIRGSDNYMNSIGVDAEEMIILYNHLMKEGARVTMKRN